MGQIIFLVNEYPGILDLSSINDVEGKRVVLQPKGMPGSERECFAEIESHPHITTFKQAGRLSIRRSTTPKADPAPARVAAKDPATGKTDIAAAAAPEPAPLPPPPAPPAPPVEIAMAEPVSVSDAVDVKATPADDAGTPAATSSRRRRQ